MSKRSMVVPLTVCVFFGVLLGSGRSVRAHVVTTNPSVQTGGERYGGENPGPVGVDFVVEPPSGRTTRFFCKVGVRSLLTGEGILREEFPPNRARRRSCGSRARAWKSKSP